jgi:subtilase family serine protease
MADPDGDGRYATPPIRAPEEGFSGVYFNVTAIDPGGNVSFTARIYVQVASAISVAATLTPSSVFPGESVEIRGGAEYESNSSTPAKFSRVDFRIVEVGTTWSSVTDGSGTFASTFSAPMVIASYAINVTVSNRTINGAREKFLVVATAPTPDLALRSNSLSIQPESAAAGDVVTVSFAVENRGDAAAGPFAVTVTVKDSSDNVAYTREFPTNGMAAGGQTGLSTTWTATEGAWIVRVIVDSGQQVSELSEENNRAGHSITVAPGPPEGLSATLMVGLVMAGVGVAAAVAFAYRWRVRRTKLP